MIKIKIQNYKAKMLPVHVMWSFPPKRK